MGLHILWIKTVVIYLIYVTAIDIYFRLNKEQKTKGYVLKDTQNCDKENYKT